MDESTPLEPSDRLRLVPCATRRLGDDLLVSAGGATRPVERLSGTGPSLWRSFGRGLTIRGAAQLLADETRTPLPEVEPHVLAFARRLVDARLAVRADRAA
ncbi:MAG: hypothetical protein ACLGI8_05460 [Acidimicrobiia bacterium]